MNNKGSPNNAEGSEQLDLSVRNIALRNTISIGVDVPEIANMSVRRARCSMILSKWVEVALCAGASLAEITQLVNVESALGIRIIASDVIGDGHFIIGGFLEKRDGSLDLFAVEHSYGFDWTSAIGDG